MSLGKEPVAILNAVLAVLNAVQLAVLGLPAWAHTLIAVASIAISTVLARGQVTPKQSTPTG